MRLANANHVDETFIIIGNYAFAYLDCGDSLSGANPSPSAAAVDDALLAGLKFKIIHKG